MKTVAFLGSKDIGLECLKHLHALQDDLDFKIEYVLTNSKGEGIAGFCEAKSITVVNSLSDLLLKPDFDIGISVQYHEILKKVHIAKAREIFINLHMAPLPEYRGCNQFSFAIINQDRIFGTTVHRLEEGIDSGDIIIERRFKIPANCWVNDLYLLTFKESLVLFEEAMPIILEGRYKLTTQASLLPLRKTEIHYRKEIEQLKVIDLTWEEEKISRHIRATLMPGFEPPHAVLNGDKIYFIKDVENQ